MVMVLALLMFAIVEMARRPFIDDVAVVRVKACPPHKWNYDTNQKLYCLTCLKNTAQVGAEKSES